MIRSKLLLAMKQAELRSIEVGEPERWSVARLARVTGLARSTIERLVKDPAVSTLGTVEAVAQALGVEITDLVEIEASLEDRESTGS